MTVIGNRVYCNEPGHRECFLEFNVFSGVGKKSTPSGCVSVCVHNPSNCNEVCHNFKQSELLETIGKLKASSIPE